MDLLNNYIYLKVLIEVLDGLEELGEASVQQLVILQIVRRNLRHFSHSSVIYKFWLSVLAVHRALLDGNMEPRGIQIPAENLNGLVAGRGPY